MSAGLAGSWNRDLSDIEDKSVIQTASQLIARFKMGNKQNILPKKEYLKCLFTLIIALNGKFLSNFLIFLNCDTIWLRGA